MKTGRIIDGTDNTFEFEYDNMLGKKNSMRLDALTYEGAILEAKAYLGINADDHDAEGAQWDIE
jgi:hypothetical protein